MTQRTSHAKALALILVFLMAGPYSLMAQNSGPQLPPPGSTSVSKQQQEQLGLQAMGEVYKQMPVLPDSNSVTRYVQDLGRKLVGTIPSENSWPYQFHVIQEKDINAFALPGGPIFINIGTIQAADNEAELVGVMAHEMSHVYMQHSAKQMPKQTFAQILAGIAGAVLPGSTAGNLARLGIQIGAGTILMKYSRADEAQADATGAIIMYRAGYNPKAMADFFQKLEKQGGGGGPQFLSDHPNPGNRYEAINKEIQGWPPVTNMGNGNTFAGVKQAASQVKAYTAQEIDAGAKQGTWQRQNQQNGAIPPNVPSSPSGNGNDGNNGGNTSAPPPSGNVTNVSFKQVKPSSRFTQLQQNGFTISYPDNWQAGNGMGGILIAPQAGASQDAIAYGVLIGAGQDQNAQSLDQATQDLIQNFQQSNPGMRVSGSVSSIRVGNTQGRSATLIGSSPVQSNGQPAAERDWLVTAPRPQGEFLYLLFIAPDKDFNQLRPTYQKMLRSLQVK